MRLIILLLALLTALPVWGATTDVKSGSTADYLVPLRNPAAGGVNNPDSYGSYPLSDLPLAPKTHVTDTDNPHDVTAEQAGADPAGSAAAVQAELDSHSHEAGSILGIQDYVWANGIPRYLTDPSPLPVDRCWVLVGTGLSCSHDGTTVTRYAGSTGTVTGAAEVDSIEGITLAAYPGAEGFGNTTAAGRGGDLYIVDSLSDTETVSLVSTGVYRSTLRGALQATGARTVVFEVGGLITSSGITLGSGNSNVTVYGQTAPSPGITLKATGDAGIRVAGATDVVMQHIRIRGNGTTGADMLNVWAGTDLLFDHMSVSWAKGPNNDDENVSISPVGTPYPKNISFTHGIYSTGLAGRNVLIAYTDDEPADNFTLAKNIMMSTTERHPRVHTGVEIAVVNNLGYNTGTNMAAVGTEGAVEAVEMSWVGNYSMAGPDYTPSNQVVNSAGSTGHTLYVLDNINPHGGITNMPTSGTAPVPYSNVNVLAASVIKSYLTTNAGARPYDRDAPDTQYINCIKTGSGCSIASSIPGGFPSYPSSQRTFYMPADHTADTDGDGWTDLEEIIYNYTRNVEDGTALPF